MKNDQIYSIIKKLNLKILEEQESGQKRFFTAKVQGRNRKNLLFKCNLILENKALNRIKKEINFHKQIDSQKAELLSTPKYITSGKLNQCFWLLREFIDASLAGDIHELKNKDINKNHIDQLVKIIFNQNNILKDIKWNKTKLNFINYEYCLNLLNHDINYAKFYNFSQNELDKIKKIVKNINIKKEDYIVGHGDINPKNILINKNKIWLFDWERLSKTTTINELGFFWTSCWNNEKLRSYFIKQAIKRLGGKDKSRLINNLSAVLILRCLGEIRYWQTLPENINYITSDKNSIFRARKAIGVHLETLKKIIQNRSRFLERGI